MVGGEHLEVKRRPDYACLAWLSSMIYGGTHRASDEVSRRSVEVMLEPGHLAATNSADFGSNMIAAL